MPFHDPFLACLLALLGLLLCGDEPVRVLVSGLWRSVPVSLWRQGGCHMVGLLVAFITIGFVPHAGAAACLVGVTLVLLGGGAVFRPVWGVPALMGYGLLPAGLGGVGFMALCLWAAGRAPMSRAGRVVAILLLIGLGHKMAAAHPLLWVSSTLIIAGLCLLAGAWTARYALCRYCRLVRPLLLLGLMEIARQQGLPAGVETAFCAILLDLTCQSLTVIWPRSAVLNSPIPPLPGFVVGWMGLHAALGLSAGTEGWAVIGCFLAVMVMGLSLGDGVVTLSEVVSLGSHYGRFEGGCVVALAALLPSFCGIAARYVLGRGGHGADWFYCLPGGDGSMLALPLFWLVWLGLGMSVAHGHLREWKLFMRVEPWVSYMQAPPRDLWSIRRFIRRGWTQMRLLNIAHVADLSSLPLRDPGAVFWLLFLGCVLVVLGVTQ